MVLVWMFAAHRCRHQSLVLCLQLPEHGSVLFQHLLMVVTSLVLSPDTLHEEQPSRALLAYSDLIHGGYW